MLSADPSRESAHSVTQWIEDLKGGDAEAARLLWGRYASELVLLARSRLGRAPRRAADEEDVALSVFDTICRGAAEGRFTDLSGRDELWWLLLAITRQKAVDQIRRETADKRGQGAVRVDVRLFERGGRHYRLEEFIGNEPTPEFLVILAEQHQRLMGLLRDDRLRELALLRIEGYHASEIAERMGIAERSVERKLKLIRHAWSQEFEHDLQA